MRASFDLSASNLCRSGKRPSGSLAPDLWLWLWPSTSTSARLPPALADAANPHQLLSLHTQFGSGFKHVRQMKLTFTEALNLAAAVYPEARVEIDADGMVPITPNDTQAWTLLTFSVGRGNDMRLGCAWRSSSRTSLVVPCNG
jgi:hypothetical protein